jgi:hypothetical protein
MDPLIFHSTNSTKPKEKKDQTMQSSIADTKASTPPTLA